MSRFKYRLVEINDEETPSGTPKEKKHLILSIPEGSVISLKDVEEYLNNPKLESLKGFYIPRDKDFEIQIFGYPNIHANKPKNKNLLNTQIEKYGEPSYKKIEVATGKKFKGFQPTGFPLKNKDNIELIKSYSPDKIRNPLRWEKVKNNTALKFFTDNKASTSNLVSNILSSYGLQLDRDYILNDEKIEENKLKSIVKEQILKFYKK